MRPLAWLSLVAAAGIAVGGACGGSSQQHQGFGVDASTGEDATADVGASDDGGMDVGSFGDDSEAGGCALHCSADLHDVLDCTNKVVTMCPSDQGCGGTSCVAACDAAKANKSTIGCEYLDVDPEVFDIYQGSCFAAFVANTWTTDVTIAVDLGGMKLTGNYMYIAQGTGQSITYQPLPGGKLAPNQVALVFLSEKPGAPVACPPTVQTALAADGQTHGTAIGKAFHIVTSEPVVAYDIFPYGGGSAAVTSATLLIPTSAWDTNYVAVDPYPQSMVGYPGLIPWIDVVAREDGTTVTISPTADIVGSATVAATAKGKPHTYNLNQGEVLQFEQADELVGSPIQSNKPVGVWGGSACLNIDVAEVACDEAHQQIAPVQALGSEYVGVRYRNRFDNAPDEAPPWRVLGAVDGTKLTYEPSTPMGAPTTINSGQLVQFWAPGPFVVKSQDAKHPFYISAHMSGCQHANGSGSPCRGDPEFVNMIPPQQYLASYVFFTDPTYPETNLVVVRQKSQNGFADVKLDCAGTLTGWQPVGNGGQYEYTRIDLVRHNFQGQNGCDNGRHAMTSSAPFGLTVWGWGTEESTPGTEAVSYAYPAGMSVQPINTVVVPPNPK
jgi:IgGFc binding protein